MTTTVDEMSGWQLADMLLEGVSDDRMIAATRMLGSHRDGFWLRRLLADEELAAMSSIPLIDRTGRHPAIEWDAMELLLLRRPHALTASRSEMAMLEVAMSLAGGLAVNLGKILCSVDDRDFKLIVRALVDAADCHTA
ncbi:hypothetical protein J7E99_35125 [Streptomyces sp. ISL-44]|uniref:hypothetical protein n=1 Tax=Streptomyces sp. ISL-44 TaxID=2819184 RepID=UPI001BED3AE9|nr:hypothetical protein [Streptomyces sp. ISL-44]MBT2545773.1 hypothetical protein [Streptomyces sp. ISL-44]